MSAIIADFFLGGLQGDMKSGQAENGQGKLKFQNTDLIQVKIFYKSM